MKAFGTVHALIIRPDNDVNYDPRIISSALPPLSRMPRQRRLRGSEPHSGQYMDEASCCLLVERAAAVLYVRGVAASSGSVHVSRTEDEETSRVHEHYTRTDIQCISARTLITICALLRVYVCVYVLCTQTAISGCVYRN